METSIQSALLALTRQAETSRKNGDLNGALDHTQKALDLVPEKQTTIRAKILSSIGFLQAEMKNISKSKASFATAHRLFEETDNVVAMAIQIGNIGSVHRDQGDFAKALEYYTDALAILKEQNFEPAIADQHANIAYAYSQQHNTSLALDSFARARELYEKTGQTERAALCVQNIELLARR